MFQSQKVATSVRESNGKQANDSIEAIQNMEVIGYRYNEKSVSVSEMK